MDMKMLDGNYLAGNKWYDNDGIIKSATTSTQYGIDSMYVTFDNN